MALQDSEDGDQNGNGRRLHEDVTVDPTVNVDPTVRPLSGCQPMTAAADCTLLHARWTQPSMLDL